MNTDETTEWTGILEGAERPITSASQHLEQVGVENTVTLAEDCKPGA